MKFNAKQFWRVLDTKRHKQRMSWRGISREIAVVPSTFTRLGRGMCPTVDALAKMLAWAGVSFETFVSKES